MEHECPECTFVASRESIFVDRQIRERVGNKPIYVGTFTLPNWSGHLKFYLCRCPCGKTFVDYPHGYTDSGHLFFTCDVCEATILVEDKKIYQESGTEKPSLFKNLLLALRLRFNPRQAGN